jgi:hypothetical protein
MTSAGWYLRRLSRMGPAEVAGRALDVWRVRRWRSVLDGSAGPAPAVRPGTPARLPVDPATAVPAAAAARLIATADRIMDGHHEYFGVPRDDMVSPDWSVDPSTGRRAPTDTYAFDVPYRDEQAVGNVKQLWEPSRHQHLTVLAGAYAVTGADRYADRVADHLKSWWAANPPMRGVHWVSGIELGIRLISWVWTRRLLDGWPGAASLFEGNPEATEQIWYHQRWLAAFPSRGSSANNHVIAEAAGALSASCAFGWYPESARWRTSAMRTLDVQLRRNTFGSGLNRELASEYHGLVLELGLAAAIEAEAAGFAIPDSTWDVLVRMTDALAAVVDTTLAPPRQGDSDDGHGLILDGAGTHRWASLLATGAALFGPQDWWPARPVEDARTPLLTALARPRVPVTGRPARRPAHLADAGMTILRRPAGEAAGEHRPEIWVRCDGGPHGFLSIAAHAHADALSIEVRHDGVELLADPGTYCYHGEPEWRAYFRSTLGHNTLELDGTDQSRSGGPFMWTRHAGTRVLATPDGRQRWQAEHDGYAPAVHRRTVELDDGTGRLRIVDEVRGGDETRPCRLAYHLGPTVDVELAGHVAWLSWTHDGQARTAVLDLPDELRWTAHRAESEPPLGWYSPGFGRLEPATTLVGTGHAGDLTTLLHLDPGEGGSPWSSDR